MWIDKVEGSVELRRTFNTRHASRNTAFLSEHKQMTQFELQNMKEHNV